MVTSMPRMGLNPYALGMRLFDHVEDMANKGMYSYDFQRTRNAQARREYDRETGSGRDYVFKVREDFDDFMFINTFIDQEFVDRHKLFVVGQRLNSANGKLEYYIQSRDAAKYRQMLLNGLYHPPCIEIDKTKSEENCLYLNHRFEGKPLVREFIPNTMVGIEYLWGGAVKLETSEPVGQTKERRRDGIDPAPEAESLFQRVLYTMKDRQISRAVL